MHDKNYIIIGGGENNNLNVIQLQLVHKKIEINYYKIDEI